mgnify:CR=1 FL=1
MKLKRTASLLMSSALIASALSMSAFAAPDGLVTAPGAGNTPVTVTAEASTFNVTVPTAIPLAVKADGSVTVPENVEIINNSSGPVKVTSVAMNNSAWSMTDYNGGSRAKIAAEKVGSKKLGLSLTAKNEAEASNKDGNQTFSPTKWLMQGKDGGTANAKLPITVGAIATANDTAISVAETAANVIFTLAWDAAQA